MSVDFRLWHEAEMTGAAMSMENRETFCSIEHYRTVNVDFYGSLRFLQSGLNGRMGTQSGYQTHLSDSASSARQSAVLWSVGRRSVLATGRGMSRRCFRESGAHAKE